MTTETTRPFPSIEPTSVVVNTARYARKPYFLNGLDEEDYLAACVIPHPAGTTEDPVWRIHVVVDVGEHFEVVKASKDNGSGTAAVRFLQHSDDDHIPSSLETVSYTHLTLPTKA